MVNVIIIKEDIELYIHVCKNIFILTCILIHTYIRTCILKHIMLSPETQYIICN